MNILDGLASWFKSAWNTITGIPGDLGSALSNLWHLVQNQHSVVSWIFGYPLWHAVYQVWRNLNAVTVIQQIIADMNRRAPGWTWLEQIQPQVAALNGRISQLKAWTAHLIYLVWVEMAILYAASLAYTRRLVSAERAQRIAAIIAEHAAMLRAVAACLATVQAQAASGYNSGLKARLTLAGTLLNDLADRNPVIRGAVSALVNLLVDLESVDNPVIRFVIGKLLSEIIAHAGIDQATGDLLTRLLGPIVGQPKASGLFDVAQDVSNRLAALETQWADFMTAGGPEVEQAGREWKDLTSLTTDVALLALFGLAVTDPQGWATAAADTIGTAGNATLTAVVDLIHSV